MNIAVDSIPLALWAAEAHRLGYMEELLEFHVIPHALPPSQIFGDAVQPENHNADDFVDIVDSPDHDGEDTFNFHPRHVGQYPHTAGSLGSTPPASPLPRLSADDFNFDVSALSVAMSSTQCSRTARGQITTHTCLAHGRVFNMLPRQDSTDSGVHLELTPQDMLDLALSNLYNGGSAFPGDMPGFDSAAAVTAAALKSAVDQQNALDSICAQLGGRGLHAHMPMGLEHVAGGKSSNACHNCGTATTTMWRRNKEGAYWK